MLVNRDRVRAQAKEFRDKHPDYWKASWHRRHNAQDAARLSGEGWRDVPGFDGAYQAHPSGAIRRSKRVAGSAVGRVLKGRIDEDGYHRVEVRDAGRLPHNLGVHKLIALTFVGPQPSAEHQVNHKDGDKLNNTPQNLEWVTGDANIAHAFAAGLRKRRAT